MEIVSKVSDWLPTDSERLASFLDTETGKRFLPFLAEQTPSLLAKGDVNEILIRAGEVRGVQEVLKSILAMAHAQLEPVAAASAYPPLEDDKAWADGQILQAPKPDTNPTE